MRVVMTLLVRDEEEMLADQIDYHLARGVDHVIATDNGSTDGTVAILEGYRDRGVLTLLHEPGRDYRQAEWVTRMARLAAAEHAADWVVNADADEFYWPEEGRDLKTCLAAVPPEYGVLEAPMRNFRPVPGGGLRVRETLTLKPGGGLALKAIHRGSPDVEVGRGNHAVDGDGMRVMPGWRPIVVLHAPMRAREQYVEKIVGGGALFKPWLTAEQLTPQAAGRVFDEALVDDGALRAGIREGSLVLDERLAACVAALRAGEPPPPPGSPRGSGSLAWPELDPEVAELRARAVREAYAREHSPEADDLRRLHHALRQVPARLRARLRR